MADDDLRALDAGLPPNLLLVLMRARRLWHASNSPDPPSDPEGLSWPMPQDWWIDEDLAAAVTHPSAPAFDEVFVAAMRRRIH